MSGLEALLAQQVIGLSEAIDDEVASLLVAGTGISLTYNDGAGTLTIANTGLGGSTGSTDNRILRSDGTDGATVQNSAVTIDDSGNISGLAAIACGAITSSGIIESASGGLYSSGQIKLGGNGGQILAGTALRFHLANGDGFNFISGSLYPIASFGSNFADNVVDLGLSGSRFRDGLFSRHIILGGLLSLGTYTVATLPSASANAGRIGQVTDSSVTTNGSAVAGSGSNRVIVFSNGTTWDVVVA